MSEAPHVAAMSEDGGSGRGVEQVEASHVDAEPHAVARPDLELRVDPRGDRVATDRAVDELVGAEHLGHLDLQVEAA